MLKADRGGTNVASWGKLSYNQPQQKNSEMPDRWRTKIGNRWNKEPVLPADLRLEDLLEVAYHGISGMKPSILP
jgi:hypothetical protein